MMGSKRVFTSGACDKAQRLFHRQSGECFYCGILTVKVTTPLIRPPKNFFTVDHVNPRARGGTSRIGNLVGSCLSCNNVKADMNAVEFLAMFSPELLLSRHTMTRAEWKKARAEARARPKTPSEQHLSDYFHERPTP